VKFTSLFSKSTAINWLSAARLFLFASRDVWFVVGLPVFLSELGWSFNQIGAFIALWFIGYGFVQAMVPNILRLFGGGNSVDGSAAWLWAFILLTIPLGTYIALRSGIDPSLALMIGLAIFAVVFAVNSAVHSYLVLSYSDADAVSVDVGFYYMANAGGRLLGTLLSGLLMEYGSFNACLIGSATLILLSALLALKLPRGSGVSLDAAISASE